MSSEDLLEAVIYHKLDEVVRLLDAGRDIEATDAEGKTPLLLAAERNNLPMVRLLVESGANVAHRDFSNNTATDLSKYRGESHMGQYTQECWQVVEYLKSRG
jgi:ankyrin repeat protein